MDAIPLYVLGGHYLLNLQISRLCVRIAPGVLSNYNLFFEQPFHKH
jgi:hypothetical protein